ncbi:MAG: DUF2254 domain-containing protein [Paracoccaceae bacterium]
MVSKLRFRIRRLLRKVWVPVVAYGLLGVATSLGAGFLRPVLPDGLAARIGANAVEAILTIIATSMLTVTTFSLSIMVTAFGAATTGATPRATALLKGDTTTQRVLATFIGAFLFALVGIIGLRTGIYGDEGRVLLFLVTLAVLAVIVISLMRWIAHLTDFGRLDDTIARVEEAASTALRARVEMPWFGGHKLTIAPSQTAHAVPAATIGYVQHVDAELLNDIAEELEARIWLQAQPGTFVHPAADLLRIEPFPDAPEMAAATVERLREAFTVAPGRTFEQDPRFGILALAEIASRALSPAVNDPGTGIDILGRLVRVLSIWEERPQTHVKYPRLWVPPIRAEDLVGDAFHAIARDGAGLVEVQIRLQKSLAAVAELAPDIFAAPALEQARAASALAAGALPLAEDRARVAALVEALEDRLASGRLKHALRSGKARV